MSGEDVRYCTNDCGCGCGRRTGFAFVVSRLRGASWQPKAGTQGTRAHTHTESKCVCVRRSTGGVDTRREDTTGGAGEGAHQQQRESEQTQPAESAPLATHQWERWCTPCARTHSHAHAYPQRERVRVLPSQSQRDMDHCCRQPDHAAHPELAPAAADTERRCRGRRQRRCSIEMVAT